MAQSIKFSANAQLYENESGELLVRFANNLVFECRGRHPDKSFVRDVFKLMEQGERPEGWQMVPYRKLLTEGQNWQLVSSVGFLDGVENRPAIGLEVKPESLGEHARRYLQLDIPQLNKS